MRRARVSEPTYDPRSRGPAGASQRRRGLFAFRRHPRPLGPPRYLRVAGLLRFSCWAVGLSIVVLFILGLLALIGGAIFIWTAFDLDGEAFGAGLVFIVLIIFGAVFLTWAIYAGLLGAVGWLIQRYLTSLHLAWLHREPRTARRVQTLGWTLLALALLGLGSAAYAATFVQGEDATGFIDPTVPWQVRLFMGAIPGLPSLITAILALMFIRLPSHQDVQAEFQPRWRPGWSHAK